jgi:uncharacterized protein YdcH (DUF465 family)
MEPREVERIEGLAGRHEELRRLWAAHRTLEAELADLDRRRFLTPEEEQRRKQLQKAKLAGRDRIQAILDEQR